jgi:hypothetical protein
MIKVYTLHDAETEEALGVVTIVSDFDGEEELNESWEEFNKLEEQDMHDHKSITDFVQWHNQCYLSEIEEVNTSFIQH